MEHVATIAATVTGVLTSLGLLWTGGRRVWKAHTSVIREIVQDELERFTKPIQPNFRNGGHSLADVAHNLQRIQKHLGIE